MSKSKQNIIPFYTTITLVSRVIVVLFPICSFAQQHDSLNGTHPLSEVVVTGQYGENSLKRSLYQVKIIDEKRFQQQGAFNLKDVLANELNIRINNDPALGSGLSIQGISGQNIKIMMDGVPITGRENGSIDLGQINLNNIERIEYVEGPMSVNFGTDALGGVINLISKKPKQRQSRLGFTGYTESSGQFNGALNSSFSNGKWNLQLNAARNFFNGFTTDESKRSMLWKPHTQYFGDMNLGRVSKAGEFRLQNSFFDEKVTDRDTGVITPYYAYAQDHYYRTRRITNSLFWHLSFAKKYATDVVISHNYYRRINNTVHKDLVSLEETLVPSAELQDTSYFNTWMSRGTFVNNHPGSGISYQAGYELNHESVRGQKIENAKQSISDYNVFGSAEMKAGERILIRPGVRYIYNTKFNAPLVPSVNVKWDIRDYLVIRASYGRGFRAPSLKELFLSLVDPNHNVHGNHELRAEIQDNYQLSAGFEFRTGEKVYRLEPSAFYNNINNKIDLAYSADPANQDPGLPAMYRYINVSKFQSKGLNLNMEYRTPVISLIGGYSFTGINNNLMSLPQTDKYFYSWQARMNVNYIFKPLDMNYSLFFKYADKINSYRYDLESRSVTTGFIDGYGMLDATVSKKFLNRKLQLTFGSRNILNVIRIGASSSGNPHDSGNGTTLAGVGRTWFCGLNYVLDFTKN